MIPSSDPLCIHLMFNKSQQLFHAYHSFPFLSFRSNHADPSSEQTTQGFQPSSMQDQRIAPSLFQYSLPCMFQESLYSLHIPFLKHQSTFPAQQISIRHYQGLPIYTMPSLSSTLLVFQGLPILLFGATILYDPVKAGFGDVPDSVNHVIGYVAFMYCSDYKRFPNPFLFLFPCKRKSVK